MIHNWIWNILFIFLCWLQGLYDCANKYHTYLALHIDGIARARLWQLHWNNYSEERKMIFLRKKMTLNFEVICRHTIGFYPTVLYTDGLKFCKLIYMNALWPSDAIWRRRTWSTLICWLAAPKQYLNRCWLTIKQVLCHSFQRNSCLNIQDVNPQDVFDIITIKITATSPRGWWINCEIGGVTCTCKMFPPGSQIASEKQ